MAIVVPLLDQAASRRRLRSALRWRIGVFARVVRRRHCIISPIRCIGAGPVRLSIAHRRTQADRSRWERRRPPSLTGAVGRAHALPDRESCALDGWTYFDPQPTAASIDPRHYRDSGAERDGRRPTIDSDVISGAVDPALSAVPATASQSDDRQSLSRDLAAAVASGRWLPDNAAAAACVGSLYKVCARRRGRDQLAISFTRDADSDFVGVLAYLPTADLQPGPHELTIDAPGNTENAPRELIKIPFYSLAR